MHLTLLSHKLLPILAIALLALFVVVLSAIGSAPAKAQDQYSATGSSTPPDYTPDPPSGCFTPWAGVNGEATQVCLDGTEPMYPVGGGWQEFDFPTYLTPDASPSNPQWIYSADVYSPDLLRQNGIDLHGYNVWDYSPDTGWAVG